jgi:hypothetical protein
MNEQKFWQVIESSLKKAQADQDLQLEEVIRQLERLKTDELIEFQRIFDQKLANAHSWPLWGAAYLINGGCSDDGFVYFCAWLISRGEKIYSAAIENPDSLSAVVDPNNDDYEFEDLWGVARDVYGEKVEEEMPPTSGEWQTQPYGERWDFDDDDATMKRLPSLAKLYS